MLRPGRFTGHGIEIRFGIEAQGAYGAVAFKELEEWRLDAYLKMLHDNVLSLGAGVAGASTAG